MFQAESVVGRRPTYQRKKEAGESHTASSTSDVIVVERDSDIVTDIETSIISGGDSSLPTFVESGVDLATLSSSLEGEVEKLCDQDLDDDDDDDYYTK